MFYLMATAYHSNSVPGQWSSTTAAAPVTCCCYDRQVTISTGVQMQLSQPSQNILHFIIIMKNILRAKAKLSNIKYFNLYVVSIEFFSGHLNHKCKLCPLNCHYYFNMRSTLVFKHKKCKFVRPNCRIVAAW